MSVKSLMFLTSALASAGLVIEPVAAAANGMSQLGTWGLPQGAGKTVSNLSCDGVPGVGSNILQMNVPRVAGANTSNAFRPNVNSGANVPSGNVTGNIGFSKPLNVYHHNNDNSGVSAEAAGSSIEASSRTYFGKPLNVFGGAGENNSQAGFTGNGGTAISRSPAAVPTPNSPSPPMAARARRPMPRRRWTIPACSAAIPATPRRRRSIRCSAPAMPAASMPPPMPV